MDKILAIVKVVGKGKTLYGDFVDLWKKHDQVEREAI